MKCLGIAVIHDTNLKMISESRGVLWWKKIVIGNSFFNFPEREKMAILLHEAGHCKLHHVEKRILSLWLAFWPTLLARYCQNQEYQADYFVAKCGYGDDLASAFLRMIAYPQGAFHPAVDSRIARLRACSRG